VHPLRKNRPFRRALLASAATVSGVVLLLSLKPHTAPALAVSSPSTSSASGSGGSGALSQAGTRSVTGDLVDTRWGPVQVRITVRDGRLTDVVTLAKPTDNPRDLEIDDYALPQLRREALAAQSAGIDSVSGATYTSEGYIRSLQSALDSAAG
jgi:uncharacterized protein with FMN-binding domain